MAAQQRIRDCNLLTLRFYTTSSDISLIYYLLDWELLPWIGNYRVLSPFLDWEQSLFFCCWNWCHISRISSQTNLTFGSGTNGKTYRTKIQFQKESKLMNSFCEALSKTGRHHPHCWQQWEEANEKPKCWVTCVFNIIQSSSHQCISNILKLTNWNCCLEAFRSSLDCHFPFELALRSICGTGGGHLAHIVMRLHMPRYAMAGTTMFPHATSLSLWSSHRSFVSHLWIGGTFWPLIHFLWGHAFKSWMSMTLWPWPVLLGSGSQSS